MKPSGLLWILTVLFILTAVGCGLPVGVYLAGDIIESVNPENERELSTDNLFYINLESEQRYEKNGLRFYYSLGEEPIDSKQRTLNHIVISFNDKEVMYHDLFKDASRGLFGFSVEANTDDGTEKLIVSYAFDENPSLTSETSDPIDIDRSTEELMFIYAQYVVEGFVVGKVQTEVFEASVIHIATYRIGK